MNSVVSLFRITKELKEILEHPISKESRDENINRISNLLEERDQLLPTIKPPFTTEEKELGKEVVEMNTFIDEQLDKIKREIQLDISKLKKSKETTNKYTNPYQTSPADGMFFDKRK